MSLNNFVESSIALAVRAEGLKGIRPCILLSNLLYYPYSIKFEFPSNTVSELPSV